MIPSKDLPQLYGKIAIQGKDSDSFISFAESLKINKILSTDNSPVLVFTEKGVMSNCDNYSIAYPYHKGFKKSKVKCKKILTYAFEDNNADVVAKNIMHRNNLVTFELLAPDGIGRIYIGDTHNESPKYALALACGLMLTGLSSADAIALISQEYKKYKC